MGSEGAVESGNKKQVNVGYSQVYYTGVLPGEDQRRKAREGGGRNAEAGSS